MRIILCLFRLHTVSYTSVLWENTALCRTIQFCCFFWGGRRWLITGYISRVTRRMPPVDCLPFLSIWAYFRLFWEPYLSIFMLCLMLSRSLSVLLSFFFWPLYFLSFFDLRLRLTRFGNFRLFLEVKLH